MDANTRRVLARISADMPEHLRKNVMKNETDVSMEEAAKKALKDPKVKLTKEGRYKVEKMIAEGRLRKTEKVVNEANVREIDRYHEQRIAAARRSGLLPDPRNDKWAMDRMKRSQKQR